MTHRFAVSFAAALAACALSARAEVKLASLFADHAVLQRDRALPVWGTATPGEKVRVALAGKSAEATADAEGRWRAELPALPAGGPFELVANDARATDVYVGEVWIASGQSNMEFTVSRSVKRWAGTKDEAAEIAAAYHPMIRMFTVPLTTGDTPARDVPPSRSTTRPSLAESTWHVCSPETVPAFSAPGYFFARELLATQKVPVGIVVAAYGASTAQAWISRDALARSPELSPMLAAYDQAKADYASGAATRKADEALAAWTATTRASTAASQPRKPGRPKDLTRDQHSPTVCYNAMIAPVEAYSARGAIWYQGESNGIDNQFYLTLMKTLITDWRSRRGPERFPFIQVQLAGLKTPSTQPAASKEIANVREAQRLSSAALPDAATVTAFDIGHRTNVHPDNKQEVGRRLALAARAIAYGEAIEWSGPQLDRASVENDRIRVTFTHAKGLAVKAGSTTEPATAPTTPQSFAVLSDGDWRWAEATIDGETIVVKLNPGERPTEVCYAWADNPTTANLVNGEGLPALPFRAELK